MAPIPRERLSIVVPTYRAELVAEEEVSLRSTFRRLGEHHLVLAKPAGLDTRELERRFPFRETVAFAPDHFASARGYSRLLLSEGFYDAFAGSEYVLLCQLDVFVFRDDLASWIDRGYDYVGAPWVSRSAMSGVLHWGRMRLRRMIPGRKDTYHSHELRNRVGNGGFSLRRVASHRRLAGELRGVADAYASRHLHEDVFWSLEPHRHDPAWRTPGLDEVLSFAWDINPGRLHRLSRGRLPMAAHGWFRPRRIGFWSGHVAAARAAS
jgi:hypothetical protein